MLKHVETTSFGLTLALFSERIHQYTSDVEVYYELVEAADLPSMNTLSNFPTAICRRLRPSQEPTLLRQAYVAAKRIESLFFLEESHLPAVKGIASFLPEAGFHMFPRWVDIAAVDGVTF